MGLRWAFSLCQAEKSPNFELYFRRALEALPSQDVVKQERFHFRNDSLACVVGRIMIRAAAQKQLGTGWHATEVATTERGKPYLPGLPELYFNVSHQGDYVVLASSRRRQIGVDVMRIDEERGQTAQEHILRMRKLFSEAEIATMLRAGDERCRWTAFYRIWCLKEAVLKATGIGLVNDLNTHSFDCKWEEIHRPGCFITSTAYSEKGERQDGWRFEESFIGSDHCVAVGKIYPSRSAQSARLRPKQFQLVTLEDLLVNSTPLSDEDSAAAYEKYSQKPWKDF